MKFYLKLIKDIIVGSFIDVFMVMWVVYMLFPSANYLSIALIVVIIRSIQVIYEHTGFDFLFNRHYLEGNNTPFMINVYNSKDELVQKIKINFTKFTLICDDEEIIFNKDGKIDNYFIYKLMEFGETKFEYLNRISSDKTKIIDLITNEEYYIRFGVEI